MHLNKLLSISLFYPKIPHFFIPTRKNTVNTPWGILNGEPQITHEKNDKRNHRLTQISQIKKN
ncbi:hypothetical protein SBF1_1490004 [Candidatus Desulfosporosinus infrequens]|uniref:Uncharacterized protein n=1 Tax=Candidatus Desulfosporosinus infrequens TaxID=2043169 RepID=A0A2U3K6T1_9FIRM|nr:hypothetical protein SBF1_1490004 [Candidatus Desulfosporosinus infrequens]